MGYCNAAANLYHIISVRKLLSIYNSQNEPLSEDDFCKILVEILKEPQYFDLFSEDEICTGQKDNKPTIDKELLIEGLYCLGNFDDYFELKEKTYDIPYRVLEKNEFLKYADDTYVEKTLEFISLRSYFRSISGLSKDRADDFALQALDIMHMFDGDVEFMLDIMREANIYPKNQGELDEFCRLYYDTDRKVRKVSLRGATLEETKSW